MITRRRALFLVWFLAIFCNGYLIAVVTGDFRLGLAAAFGLLAVSLGVPLMRAFTEFSK